MEERQRLGGQGAGMMGICWWEGRVISGGADGWVRVWDVEERTEVMSAEGHKGAQVRSMWVYGDKLVTGGVDGMVVVWRLNLNPKPGGEEKVLEEMVRFNAREKARAGAGESGVTAVCGYGSRVYAGWGVAGENRAGNGDVLVWDVEGSKYVNKMGGHQSWVTGMAILMEGKFLATVSLDCTIRIWSIENRSLQFFSQANREPGVLKENPTGLLGVVALWTETSRGTGKQGIVTISEGGTVDLWKVSTGTGMVEVNHVSGGKHGEGGRLESGSVGVVGARWGYGGEEGFRVVSAGYEGTVKVWEVGERGEWAETESVKVEEGRYAIEGCSGRVSADGRLAVGLGVREEGGGEVSESVRIFGWGGGTTASVGSGGAGAGGGGKMEMYVP